MKVTRVAFFLLILGFQPVLGQNIFTITDPEADSLRHGKTQYDSGPYSYVEDDEIIYHFDDSSLLVYEDDIEDAFGLWNDIGVIEFVHGMFGGVQILPDPNMNNNIIAELTTTSLYKDGTTAIETSNFVLYINQNLYTWGSSQNLFNSPFTIHVPSIILHEAGHFLGLAHPDTLDYTHNASAPVMAGSDNDYFHTHTLTYLRDQDIKGAQFLQFMIPGYYTNLQTALNSAANYDATVYVYEDYLSSSDITIPVDATLEIHDGTTLSFSNNSKLVVNGTARIRDGVSITDPWAITVAQNAKIEFTGDSDIEFLEKAVTIPGYPTLYAPGYFEIRGEVESYETVTMELSSSSTYGVWSGINVYSTASGELDQVRIEDAQTGLNFSSVGSSFSVYDIEIISPEDHGINSSSSSFHGDYVVITNSDDRGISISGGSPELDYFETTNSDGIGIRVGSYSNTYTAEGDITGSGSGGSNAGAWINNATYTHINGYNGPNSGWDVRAENNAYVIFNGTYWDGSPYTSVDGSSDLFIYNQNNPIKAATPELTAQAQLLKEWSEQYRESPEAAVEWLQLQRSSYTDELKAVSSVLLTDYYLSNQNADRASAVLSDITDEQNLFLEPGTVALRNIQLALNGAKNEALAAEAFAEWKSAVPESKSVDHVKYLLQQRYGFEFDSDTEPIVSQSDSDGAILLENFPNPFNPSTVISYSIPEQAFVQLEVFDMTGRSVTMLISEQQSAGNYEIPFNASRLSSGVYLYRLQVGDVVKTNKFTLIK